MADIEITPEQLKRLARLLGADTAELRKRFADNRREFVYLKRQLPPEEAAELEGPAQAAGLHPSTTHRILTALTNDRMVERVDQGTYRLGIRLLELGNLVKSRINVRELALPVMRELHGQTGETVNLSVRHDDEIVYVERTSSGRSAGSSSSRSRAACCAGVILKRAAAVVSMITGLPSASSAISG